MTLQLSLTASGEPFFRRFCPSTPYTHATSTSSVALTGPAVFQFTAPSAPDRHREALAVFRGVSASDASVARLSDEGVGPALFDAIASFLDGLDVPRGLNAVGYGKEDVGRLVEGTLPQRRVLDLAPGVAAAGEEEGREQLQGIIEKSLSY